MAPKRKVVKRVKVHPIRTQTSKSKSPTITKSESLRTKQDLEGGTLLSSFSGLGESLIHTTDSLVGPSSTKSNIYEEDEDVVDEASEILWYYFSQYALNPHETDSFTFPDEYVLANNYFKKFSHKISRIRLSWLSEEDVSLSYYFSIYQLNAHTTDNFTEEDEYIGTIRYYDRLRGPQIIEEPVFQIYELGELTDACQNVVKFLIFNEKLIMMSKAGEEVGELEIKMNLTEQGPRLLVEVEIESNGIVQGVACGMKSFAHVQIPNLETVYYRHHEFIQAHSEMTNNQIDIVRDDHGFNITRTETHDGIMVKEEKRFTIEEIKNFVCDASSVVIQRLFLFTSKSDEEYKFQTLTPECDLCPIYFKHLPPSSQVVCGNIINVLGIKKEVHYSEEKVFEDHIYCNKSGYILSQFPLGFPMVFRMEELIKQNKSISQSNNQSGKKINWREDLELWSTYQSRKESLIADYTSYIQRNPDLQAILTDFMQSVLIHRPMNVIQFANNYFSTPK